MPEPKLTDLFEVEIESERDGEAVPVIRFDFDKLPGAVGMFMLKEVNAQIEKNVDRYAFINTNQARDVITTLVLDLFGSAIASGAVFWIEPLGRYEIDDQLALDLHVWSESQHEHR